MNDLERFTDQAARSWQSPAASDFEDDDDEELEADEQDDTEADEDPDAELRGEWAATLSLADRRRAEADPEWAEQALEEFAFARAAAARQQQIDQGAADDYVKPEYAPRSGGEFVQWIKDNEAEVRRQHGMTGDEYLSRIAGAGRAEKQRVADEAGVSIDAIPGYHDLPRSAQTRLIADDLAAELGKLADQGKYIE